MTLLNIPLAGVSHPLSWPPHAPLTLARSRPGPDRFAIVCDRAGFDALEPEWNDLFERAGRDAQLFQTFNWNWHWANHYLPAGAGPAKLSLAIVTVHRQDRLMVLWPLVLETGSGLRLLRWMGEPVSQYGDVLVGNVPDRQVLLQRSWQFIASRLGADAVHLRKVRADAAVLPLLSSIGMRQVAVAQAPYLDLASAPDFAHYERRYSHKARKNRRRLMRRLEERGVIHTSRHTGSEEAGAAARTAVALKRAWSKANGRIAPSLADARFAAFFADVTQARHRPAGCAVMSMTCNGGIASMAIDVTCGRRRAAHIIVHDPAFNHLSPGTLLLQEWIRGASADGIATFDLLAPAYAYKADWADGSIAVNDYALGLTFAGRAYTVVYLSLLRSALKAGLEAFTRRLGRLRAWRSPAAAAEPAPQGPQPASADTQLPLQRG